MKILDRSNPPAVWYGIEAEGKRKGALTLVVSGDAKEQDVVDALHARPLVSHLFVDAEFFFNDENFKFRKQVFAGTLKQSPFSDRAITVLVRDKDQIGMLAEFRRSYDLTFGLYVLFEHPALARLEPTDEVAFASQLGASFSVQVQNAVPCATEEYDYDHC